ncbi:hypothetical protein [Wolbachia pipientis]|uniref:hypothetical protein n=1 Tax=Wolbachia pipientis TaxID=955 RepID=UPI0020B731DF|nr:hypothetical protein [Wolbachia pipientis]
MWESIKNFFQSIAYRTGISWITKKVSSGWNWLFSSKANAAQKIYHQRDLQMRM